jgi:hypothetical protein
MAKHLEQMVRLASLLGLRPKDLVSRLRDALDRRPEAVKDKP